MTFGQILLIIVSIFGAILNHHKATGIRCYDCSSSWTNDCFMSPPPSRLLKSCSGSSCAKMHTEENGITRVDRYCGPPDFSPPGCRDASLPDRAPGVPFYRRAVSCICNDQDGCNHAFSLTNSFPLLLTLSISTLFISYFANIV